MLNNLSCRQIEKERKKQRNEIAEQANSEHDIALHDLAKQSIEDKKHYQAIKDSWQDKIAKQHNTLNALNDEIKHLKNAEKPL
ncbi:hypothetical protein ACOBV9_21295 (plasmid) [Pseudoalteromonas espejiana]